MEVVGIVIQSIAVLFGKMNMSLNRLKITEQIM